MELLSDWLTRNGVWAAGFATACVVGGIKIWKALRKSPKDERSQRNSARLGSGAQAGVISQGNSNTINHNTHIQNFHSTPPPPTAAAAPVVLPAKPLSATTWQDIRAAIESSPPLQRESVAKRYVGLRIRWTGYFSTARESRRHAGIYRATFRLGPIKNVVPATLFTMHCDIPLKDFPDLTVMHEDALVVVTGVVTEATERSVELEEATLEHG